MRYWLEKMEGKKEMTPAEPLGDIHMPNGSIHSIYDFTWILYCMHLVQFITTRTFLGDYQY